MGGNQSKWNRNKPGGGRTYSGVGEAVEIEEAARTINKINYRKRYERRVKRREERARVTLPKITFGTHHNG